MATGKKKVVVYADWKSSFDALTDEEAGQLIKHFFAYVNDENPVTENRIVNLMFEQIKATLKRDLDKWEVTRNQRVEAGAKGGKQKVANASKSKQTVANLAVSDSVSVSDILLKKETKGVDFSPFGNDFEIHWTTWTAYKKSQFGFRYKELKTEQMAFDDLVKKSNNDKLQAISIINNSIVNGWKGLMPLKDVYPVYDLHSQTHKKREIGTTKSMFE